MAAVKFREHRGRLDDSMATLVEVKDRKALVDHIAALLFPYFIDVKDDMVHVAIYLPDTRIGWPNQHIVKLDGYGVIGFTDGPV